MINNNSKNNVYTRLLLLPAVIVAAVCALLVSSGCTNNSCADNRSALPLLGFYSSADNNSIALDSIDFGGVDAPGDTLLVHSGEKVSSVYFPFRYGTNEVKFYIRYNYKRQGIDNPAFNDTLTFNYTAEPYFASEECGALYVYTIKKMDYTSHIIERVEIVDSFITNVDLERVKVFFRVSGRHEGGDGEPESQSLAAERNERGLCL